tara:strand:+ start:1882 stop:3441 length:1560 start_codon:yes stop_codon:yes gene_type:complete
MEPIDVTNLPKLKFPKDVEEYLRVMPSYERAQKFYSFFQRPNVPDPDRHFYRQFALRSRDGTQPASDYLQIYKSQKLNKQIRYKIGNGQFDSIYANVQIEGYTPPTEDIFKEMHEQQMRISLRKNDNPESDEFREKYITGDSVALGAYKKAVGLKMSKEVTEEANRAATIISRSLRIPDDINSINDFVNKYAHQKFLSSGRNIVSSSDEIMQDLVYPGFYQVQSPGSPNLSFFVPKIHVTQFESLDQKDIDYGVRMLDMAIRNKEFTGQDKTIMEMATDDGSNRVGYLDLSDDGGGLVFRMADASNPANGRSTNIKVSWEEFSKFARYRVELAALEDVMHSFFPVLNSDYKLDRIREATEEYHAAFGDDGEFQKRMYLKRDLEGLFGLDSRITGMYQEPYDSKFIPDVIEEGVRTVQNMPGRVLRDAVSIWDGLADARTPIGDIEYRVFKEYLERVGPDPDFATVNRVFEEMIDERMFKETSLIEDLYEFAADGIQGLLNVSSVFYNAAKRNGLIQPRK